MVDDQRFLYSQKKGTYGAVLSEVKSMVYNMMVYGDRPNAMIFDIRFLDKLFVLTLRSYGATC